MSTNNLFASAAIPGSIGAGAGADVTSMGADKTFTLPPFGVGTIVVEASSDNGVSYAPLFSMVGPSGEPQTSVVSAACQFIRVRRVSGGDLARVLDIAGELGDPFYANLPPNGISPGPNVSVSSSFKRKTIIVTGNFTGEVVVSGTADGTSFNPIPGININGPGTYLFEGTYALMRIERVTIDSGTLLSVNVGAVGAFVGSIVNAITPGDAIDVQPPFGSGVVQVSVLFDNVLSVGIANVEGIESAAARADHVHASVIGIMNFSGTLIGGGGAVFSYLANEGVDGVANNLNAFRWRSSPRNLIKLRVTVISDTCVNPTTVTVYHNGAPGALVVSIPGGTAPYTFLIDDVDNVFVDQDEDFDIRLDNPGADPGTVLKVSVSLEYSPQVF